MKYLIFSDSHRKTHGMCDVIERSLSGLDGIIFLGDNYDDIEIIREKYPRLDIYAVAGNCDASPIYRTPDYLERTAVFDGVRVLMVHGHAHGVKWGLGEIEAYARRKGINVVLFGHTHERYDSYRDGIHLFNPGSVSEPRDGTASFGVLTVQNGQVLLSHGDVWI